jgi:hypothetical protein
MYPMMYIIGGMYHKTYFGIAIGTMLSYQLGTICILTDPWGPGTVGDVDDYPLGAYMCIIFARFVRICIILPDENSTNKTVKGFLKNLMNEFPLLVTCSQSEASSMPYFKFTSLFIFASPVSNLDLLYTITEALKNCQIAIAICQGFREAYNISTTERICKGSPTLENFLKQFEKFIVFSTKLTMINIPMELVTSPLAEPILSQMYLKLCLLIDPSFPFAPGVWSNIYGSGSSSKLRDDIMAGVDTSSIIIPEQFKTAVSKYITKMLMVATNPKITDDKEMFKRIMETELTKVVHFIMCTFEYPFLVLNEEGEFHTLNSLSLIMILKESAPIPPFTPYLYDMVMPYILFNHSLNIWKALLVFFRIKKQQTPEEYVLTSEFKENFVITFNKVNELLRKMLKFAT